MYILTCCIRAALLCIQYICRLYISACHCGLRDEQQDYTSIMVVYPMASMLIGRIGCLSVRRIRDHILETS